MADIAISVVTRKFIIHKDCIENLKKNAEILRKVEEELKVKLSWSESHQEKWLKSFETIMVLLGFNTK